MLPSWSITLPVPPSVNEMYVNRRAKGMRGRMISPKYVAWRKEAEGALCLYKPLPTFSGRVAVSIAIQETRGLADIDGRCKPLLDFLVKHRIIKGDDRRYVRMVMANWDNSIKGCRVNVSEMS